MGYWRSVVYQKGVSTVVSQTHLAWVSRRIGGGWYNRRQNQMAQWTTNQGSWHNQSHRQRLEANNEKKRFPEWHLG